MADKSEISAFAQRALDRAEKLTEAQIETALRLNGKYFEGEGLTHFGDILQALTANYRATVLFNKTSN